MHQYDCINRRLASACGSLGVALFTLVFPEAATAQCQDPAEKAIVTESDWRPVELGNTAEVEIRCAEYVYAETTPGAPAQRALLWFESALLWFVCRAVPADFQLAGADG